MRAASRCAAVAVAVVFGALLALGAERPERAFACSYQPLHWSLAADPGAALVFEGWITAAEKAAEQPDPEYVQYDLTVTVTKVHFGAVQGDELRLKARLPGEPPPVPLPCPSGAFDKDETFVGKYLVSTLWNGSTTVGRIFTFLGDQPGGSEYTSVVQVIRVATMRDPGLPKLTVYQSAAGCPVPVTLVAERLTPGVEYAIWYPNAFREDGSLQTAIADAGGRVEHRFTPKPEDCPLQGFAEVRELGPGGSGLPWAMARLPGVVGVAPLPPDAGNSPERSLEGRASAVLAAVLLALGAGGLAAGAWPHVRRYG